MPEAVVMTDRVLTSIALGESHFREFKSALQGPPGQKTDRDIKEVAKDICSTLVAFANADGGELLVGVEDNGDISGVGYKDDGVSYLERCWVDGVHKDTPLKGVRHVQVKLNGLNVLYFSVLKSMGAVHITADGKCLQRRDLESVPIASEEIQFTRQERHSQEYDRDYVDGCSADDLDLGIVKILAEQISAGMSPEKCLQYLDLADFGGGYLRLRRAALLLFAKQPNRWHPRLQIRVMRVAGNELGTGLNYNVSSDRYVEANIVSIIEEAWLELRPHLVQTRLSGEARFETKVIYPEFACREALINAIAHRDYSQEGRAIEIYVYDDRMEVMSPGGLLSSISLFDLKKLKGAHQSRNAFIARVLREMGYMREVGEGMRRIFELMQSNELAEPDIVTSSDKFIVGLRNRPLYRPEHILWLESFSEFDLSRQEKAVIVLGYNGKLLSPNDIFDDLGLVDTEEYRKIVYSLQEKRILATVVTKSKASATAKRKKISVRDVARYAVQVPPKGSAELPPEISVGKYSSGRSGKSNNPRKEKSDQENFDFSARLFLGNLRGQPDVAEILKFLWESGVNGDVSLPKNASSFAFVQLDSADLVQAAIARLDGRLYRGFPVVVRRATPRSPRTG